MLYSILRMLCKKTGTGDYREGQAHWESKDPLEVLVRDYGNDLLRKTLAGKRVLDYGCGEGWQSKSLAERFNCEVVGVDIDAKRIQRARELSGLVYFTNWLSDDTPQFDVIVSQNAFEHFQKPPAAMLRYWRGLLKPGGTVLLTFGPPWFAPFGAHMQFFCRVPWIHLIFPERVVLKVRQLYRDEEYPAPCTYEKAGLNKMTVARFERLINEGGFELVYRVDRHVRGIKVPWLRELFTNHISVVLKKEK